MKSVNGVVVVSMQQTEETVEVSRDDVYSRVCVSICTTLWRTHPELRQEIAEMMEDFMLDVADAKR